MLSSSSFSFEDDSDSCDSDSRSLDETIVDYKHRQLISASAAVIDYEQYYSVIPNTTVCSAIIGSTTFVIYFEFVAGNLKEGEKVGYQGNR